MSQINLRNLDAKDVLDVSFLQKFKNRMNYFFTELVELNVIIFLAEKIINFPFKVFRPNPNENIFLTMVMHSFYDSVILIFSRLVNDSAGDIYSLRKFKNDIRNAMNGEYRSEFNNLLRDTSFTREVEELLKDVRKYRNNAIAHKTQNYIFNGMKLTRLNIDQIKKIRDSLNKYLDVLSFNTENLMLPIPYSEKVQRPPGMDEQTDIDDILDCIARKSVILNLPETKPDSWGIRKERYSQETLEIINQYRQKFNLPAV